MGSLPPLTADAIALTEKKMDMTLDDIIQMSKKTKPKTRKQRTSNKSQRPFPNKYGARDGASKAHVQQSVAARSSALRQAKLAEMRSRNGNNQFPAVKEAARRIAVARSVQWNKRRNAQFSVPINRPLPMVSFANKVNGTVKQRPQTLDSLFANMKEQRLRAQAQAGGRQNGVRQVGGRQNGGRQVIGRQNGGRPIGGRQNGGRPTNFANKQTNFGNQNGGRPTNFANKQTNFGEFGGYQRNRQGNFGGYQRNFPPRQRSN
ncbi:uncharacterized protein LOC131030633 [Cryptomeria japonica]|uniref:uncharacterized protein LOC131030633 n=1 Tax=Cryptomeria japonica TaxID=3369 RepID=UPI0027DA27D1|nr:uncharacterized protein LOC131030633 [Cryptomeria japonica]